MANKLKLVLTFYWWDKVASGGKTCEYRRFCPGWNRRLARLNPGDEIVFRRGYTDKTLTRRLVSVRVITGWELPYDEYNFFGKPTESKFFEILFE